MTWNVFGPLTGPIPTTDLDANYDAIRIGSVFYGGTSGGSASAQTITVTPVPSAYQDGQFFNFVAGFASGAATTLNANGLGALPVQRPGASGLVAVGVGDWPVGQPVTVMVSAAQTKLVMMSPSATLLSSVSGGASAQPVSRIMGLRAANNVALPNSQYDIAADAVQMRNPTTGAMTSFVSPAAVTVDVSVAGPVIGGRDQSASFSANSWIHLYSITNGTVVSSTASAVAPPTGPTLPTGYTAWAYVGAVRYNASNQLSSTYMRGHTVYYTGSQPAATIAATTETAYSVSTLVPPNALEIGLYIHFLVTAGGGASATNSVALRLLTGVTRYGYYVSAPISETSYQEIEVRIPNIGQQFYSFKTVTGAGAASSAFAELVYYTVPNGDS